MVLAVLSQEKSPANVARRRLVAGGFSAGSASPISGQASFRSGMGENILGGKAGEIEPHPLGQEAEARAGQRLAAFAGQHGVEPGLQRMQMRNVGRGVGHLRIAQFRSPPVRRLLLLEISCPKSSRTRSLSPCLSV